MVRAGLPEGVTREQVYQSDGRRHTWGRAPGTMKEHEQRPNLELDWHIQGPEKRSVWSRSSERKINGAL